MTEKMQSHALSRRNGLLHGRPSHVHRPAKHLLVPKARLAQDTPSSSTTRPAPPKTATQTAADRRVTDGGIRDIKSLYKSLLHEYDYLVQDAWVEGNIPKDLHGTYFRNGPGMQVANERYKRHTFDGDGMILSFSFSEGRCRFKNKYVRTQGFLDEQAAGRPVHRTAFTRGAADGSFLFNPFDFTLKNVANTGVLYWAGRLLALYESGIPHELDAATLDTVGESTLDQQLKTPVLAAHYRVMPGYQQHQYQQHNWQGASNGNGSGHGSSSSNGTHVKYLADGRTWVAFSFNTGTVSDAELMFYEFAENGQQSAPAQAYKLPGVSIAMIHDIAVTPDYYVVVVGPVNFNPGKFLTEYFTSRCSIAECLVYEPSKPTKVHLVPRANGAAAGTAPYIMDAPPMFTFHHVNAFTATAAPHHSNGNGSSNGSSNGIGHGSSNTSSTRQLVLDTVAWDEVAFENNQHNLGTDYYTGGSRPTLRRLVFDLDPPQHISSSNGRGGNSNSNSTGRLVGNYQLARRTVEFPMVNWDVHGTPHRHIYCAADTVDDELHWGPTQCVMKLTLPDPLVGTQGPMQPDAVQTDIWDVGDRRLVMEPMFVPRANSTAEDDGWVLATLHNPVTDRGELVILNAQDLSTGPVATIHLQHFLPAGLHGSFTPQVFGDGLDEHSAEPAWKEPTVVRQL